MRVRFFSARRPLIVHLCCLLSVSRGERWREWQRDPEFGTSRRSLLYRDRSAMDVDSPQAGPAVVARSCFIHAKETMTGEAPRRSHAQNAKHPLAHASAARSTDSLSVP
ncbi:MAG: hypothetical protein DMF84_24695 [Acidobacteria bacterium]|nr:MAG: hypothetical protein DMF84_24695 [Acidobacteriota bacterium]